MSLNKNRIVLCFSIFVFMLNAGFLFGKVKYNEDSLRKVLDKMPNDTNLVNKLNEIGSSYLSGGDYDIGFKYLVKAQKSANELGFRRGQAISLIGIGIYYENTGSYYEAKEYYLKALEIKKEMNDRKGIADVISNMGVMYSDQGDYERALKNYFEALKIREEIKDEAGKANSLMHIANIYFLQNNFKEALKYYSHLFSEADQKNKFFLSLIYYNIGLTHKQLNNYHQALESFNLSLKISEEIGDKQGVAICIGAIGSIHTLNGNHQKALELLLKSLDILNEIGTKKEIAETSSQIAMVYVALNESENALLYFNKQLSIGKEINSKLDKQNAYSGISSVYEKMKEPGKAFEYYKLYKEMEDSVQNESTNKAIAELEIKYKTEKKEKEIELLKKNQEIKDAAYRRKMQYIYFGVFSLVVIVVLLFLLNNRKQLKRKNILERKNFELERNALSAQMNPHFIFNSLGSIGGFIAENDKMAALDYLAVFSRLIRFNLEHSRESLILIFDEIKMLKSYMHLQQMRHEGKFEYDFAVDESIDTSTAVPPMIIQPFIENAILHGITPERGSGKISIRFFINDQQELICELTDNGIGITESLKRKVGIESDHKSLSMKITKERVEVINSLNKEKIRIHTSDVFNEKNEIAGTRVRIIFPLKYI
ncbi:MAG: tetratricopeptide repeat protein [Bacteroidota bacterium]|nr:tetratricopeptide repeat protein [Bacteroidota bacterium]